MFNQIKKLKAVPIITMLAIVVALMTIKSLSSVEKLGYRLLAIDRISDWSSNKNSPINEIVNIGDGLYSTLRNHNVSAKQLIIKSKLGDCTGISKTVTHSIIIISPNDTLCIKLKYDPYLFKYHIIGYSGSIK